MTVTVQFTVSQMYHSKCHIESLQTFLLTDYMIHRDIYVGRLLLWSTQLVIVSICVKIIHYPLLHKRMILPHLTDFGLSHVL